MSLPTNSAVSDQLSSWFGPWLSTAEKDRFSDAESDDEPLLLEEGVSVEDEATPITGGVAGIHSRDELGRRGAKKAHTTTELQASSSKSTLASTTSSTNLQIQSPSHNQLSSSGTLNRNLRFIYLVSGIIIFFGAHNYMQELIMSLPGFDVGSFLGYLEVLGVTICSFFERQLTDNTPRKAPWSVYTLLCLCLLVSSATSNIALSYINYPTKVVFRSCKLIPTMMIAVLYNRRRITYNDFLMGGVISIGMVAFGAADFQVSPRFNFLGIALVLISIAADAFLPNLQERVFELGSSRTELTFYTNFLCLGAMTVGFLGSGDLQIAFQYATANPQALYLMIIYTFLAYIAISFHMTLVKEFGGIAAVLVGNSRKALTIVLSFILFPKPLSVLYIIGGVCVFGGLICNAFMKEHGILTTVAFSKR